MGDNMIHKKDLQKKDGAYSNSLKRLFAPKKVRVFGE